MLTQLSGLFRITTCSWLFHLLVLTLACPCTLLVHKEVGILTQTSKSQQACTQYVYVGMHHSEKRHKEDVRHEVHEQEFVC